MHTALHDRHGPRANVAQNKLPCVSYGGGLGKMRDLFVADADSVSDFVGKIAQSRSQHDCDQRFNGALRRYKLRRVFRLCELVLAHLEVAVLSQTRAPALCGIEIVML